MAIKYFLNKYEDLKEELEKSKQGEIK